MNYNDYEILLYNADGTKNSNFDIESKVLDMIVEITNEYWESDLYCHSIRWINYNTNMLELSLAFPDIVFQLISKNPDDILDIWSNYYFNGKYQPQVLPKIVYAPFDPMKLISAD